MHQIAKGMYVNKGVWIFRVKSGGWEHENSLSIFPTLEDAAADVDKHHDGTHKKEPRTIGHIECDHDGNLIYVYGKNTPNGHLQEVLP
jgi:hypothetical protein